MVEKFEDYFFENTEKYEDNNIPRDIYHMMLFLDYSFYKTKRNYYIPMYYHAVTKNNMIATNYHFSPYRAIIFKHMIRTFKKLFK